MAKIMVVDDEADLEILIKQKFRKEIRDHHYEFIFANNGKNALEQLALHSDVDLILSDINMPVMDGLTLLTKIQEQNLLLKSVIVSAYGDMENIRSAMNKGAFDFITKPVNFDDLEITIIKTLAYVSQLKNTLLAIRENNILKMYVDENVLKYMGNPGFEKSFLVNETVEGTVVFIDICSFTKISETETPDQVVSLINEYFDIIVSQIMVQKGIIDKFIGDAVMAIFKGPFHLDRALESCLALKKSIHDLPMVSGKIEFKPEVSIGINSGEMVSGNIGSSTLKRFDYTVIGDTVNVASRLQSIAGKNQLFITEENYLKIKEAFSCKLVGEFHFKNKAKPTIVYEVLG